MAAFLAPWGSGHRGHSDRVVMETPHIKMEDLKYKRNLGKFVASCNAPPSSVQVTVCRENESNVNAEVRSATNAFGLWFNLCMGALSCDSGELDQPEPASFNHSLQDIIRG